MTDQDTLLYQAYTAFACPHCGGTILGDGYTTVIHCEFADEAEVWQAESDANPIWCDFDD